MGCPIACLMSSKKMMIGVAGVLGLVVASGIGFRLATGKCPIGCLFGKYDEKKATAPATSN